MKISLRFVLSCLLFTGLMQVGLVNTACAAESDAGVVIRFSDDREQHYCSSFEGDTATGIEALNGTGLRVITKDFGGNLGQAVCKIEDVGTDTSDCPSSSGYWHYWHFQDGEWVESALGAANYSVEKDAIEGWTWEKGSEANPPSIEEAKGACISASGNSSSKDGGFPKVTTGTVAVLGSTIVMAIVVAVFLRRRTS